MARQLGERRRIYTVVLGALIAFRMAGSEALTPAYASAPSVITPSPSLSFERKLFKPEFPVSERPLFRYETRFRDTHIAVSTLLLEAAGEGYQGMIAVAEVIRNRAAAAGSDFGQICLARRQFSGWNDFSQARRFLHEHRGYYRQALRAWEDSAATDLTRGATDYHADYVHPYWADDYRVVAKIGRHIFYRRS